MLVTLSGCHANLAVTTTVQEDGSGTVEATATLDPEAAAGLLDLGLDSSGLPLGDLAQSGWVIEPPRTEANGNTVIQASKDFGTAAQFSQVMAELSSTDGVFQNFALTRSKHFARVDYAVTGTIDTSRGFDAFSDPALETALGRTVDDIASGYGANPQDLDLSLNVVLPGDIQDASSAAVVKADTQATQATWQASLGDGTQVQVVVASATRRVVARALRGIAVVAGVLAVLIVFARILRIVRPDRRRRPARRHVSEIRPVAKAAPEPEPVEEPVVGEQRWVALDGLGVLFRKADDAPNPVVSFAQQQGSTRTAEEIQSRLRWLHLGRITTAEFWSAIGVDGEPDALDTAYLATYQLSPGVIRYLRNLRDQGIGLACVTNEATEWAGRLRAGQSLQSLIEIWVVSGSVGVAKPDRPIFEVLRRTAQEPPSAILIIDDNLDVLDAARSYGFATAWFSAQGTRAEARDHAVIRSFELSDDELVEIDQA